MKTRWQDFQLRRQFVSLRDKPYPSTKTTFILFDNRFLKCFKSFTSFDVGLMGGEKQGGCRSIVGASLLAKAVCHTAQMLAGMAHSRAGSLPHLDQGHICEGWGGCQAVIAGKPRSHRGLNAPVTARSAVRLPRFGSPK
ncbi:hypothetical protein [Pseudomonas sp. C2B4]|uniref:hypothetical protein n=1 Tax=Pseudomonas sp. C2B4 TaxID=2735270 RepID=UPI00158638D1|nr:hypothetical protein [Pseudomonas sp. C2B4]NUU35490.1 hypothetical protein [Pseudomonas sp. C2B4]